MQCSLVHSVQLKAGFAHRIKISSRSNAVAWRLITLTSAQYADLCLHETSYCRVVHRDWLLCTVQYSLLDYENSVELY
jgi:hypothetical protein